MKILFVNNNFCILGGADRAFFNEAELLVNKGHDIIFFAGKQANNFSSKYENYFVPAFRYGSDCNFRCKIVTCLNLLYSADAKRKIEALIKQEKPDLVHLHNIYHQISPSILHVLRKFKIPIIMTLHDYKLVCASYLLLNNNKICELCKDRKYYYCFRTACVKNSRMKSLLSTFEMYLHHKILNIYNLVDVFISPSLFLKYKLREMEFRRKIVHLPNFVPIENIVTQYKPSQNHVIYFGRISHEKGLFTLIEAMKGISGAILKIIGTGPIKTVLKKKVESENIKNVIFLEYKIGEELRAEIINSICTIVPSEWYENFPYSILESFVLGRPVIASRIGGIPELVIDGVTGLTFEPSNHVDLREKLRYFLDNPALISEMGKKARELVEKEYNPGLHYQRLIDIYQKAIA